MNDLMKTYKNYQKGYYTSTFYEALFRAFEVADTQNREKLLTVYPELRPQKRKDKKSKIKSDLKIGDKVKMVNCLEASDYPDKIWTVRSMPWELGHGQEVVLLEDFSGGFCTDMLLKVNNDERDNNETTETHKETQELVFCENCKYLYIHKEPDWWRERYGINNDCRESFCCEKVNYITIPARITPLKRIPAIYGNNCEKINANNNCSQYKRDDRALYSYTTTPGLIMFVVIMIILILVMLFYF